MENLIETTLDKLHKGDYFAFGVKLWDQRNRFHSCQTIDGRLVVNFAGYDSMARPKR